MRLRSRIQECLCLNWAVPATHLPRAPESLTYETLPSDGTDFALVSALLFRHRDVHLEILPLPRLSFPQLNLRLYVLDRDRMPSVLFVAVLVPRWVTPAALLAGRRPALPARFDRTGEPGSTSGSWEWRVAAAGRASTAKLDDRRAGLHCVATLGSPSPGTGPAFGSWRETTDHVRLRNRGYTVTPRGLKLIETEQPRVAVSPVKVEMIDSSLPQSLLGVPSWPALHSAWVCPEMRMRFDLVPERSLALPRQAAVPG